MRVPSALSAATELLWPLLQYSRAKRHASLPDVSRPWRAPSVLQVLMSYCFRRRECAGFYWWYILAGQILGLRWAGAIGVGHGQGVVTGIESPAE